MMTIEQLEGEQPRWTGGASWCVAVLSRYSTRTGSDLFVESDRERDPSSSRSSLSLSLSSRTNRCVLSCSIGSSRDRKTPSSSRTTPTSAQPGTLVPRSQEPPPLPSPPAPPRDSQSTQDGLPLHQPRRARRYHSNQNCRSGLPDRRRQRYTLRDHLISLTGLPLTRQALSR